MLKRSESQKKYDSTHVERFAMVANKSFMFEDRIAYAISIGLARSKNDYISQAVDRSLNDDGITIAMFNPSINEREPTSAELDAIEAESNKTRVKR